jgi:thioredoxin reductase (NADPH)
MSENEMLDAVILGAGPAGLTALTYLARFHRSAIALGGDGPRGRVELIDRTYNLPGYPDGISGRRLLERLREQAAEMGGRVEAATAERVEGTNRDFTVQVANGSVLRARKVILAMGVHDRPPDIPGVEKHIGHFIRYCPVCDGYEHTDERLGILGSGPSVARHALFLRTFSNHISVFLHGESEQSLEQYASRLRQRGITIYEPPIERIIGDASAEGASTGKGVCLADGSEHPLSVLYSALGCDVNLRPVRHLSLKLDSEGYVVTDCRQETSVPGIYAAGDLVSNINQISVAFGQAAVAAVELHNAIGDEEGETE